MIEEQEVNEHENNPLLLATVGLVFLRFVDEARHMDHEPLSRLEWLYRAATQLGGVDMPEIEKLLVSVAGAIEVIEQ